MTTRGKWWRYSPHDLAVPLGAALLACGLTGCPGPASTGDGGEAGSETGSDVPIDRFIPEDVPMQDATDVRDVPVPSDAMDVPVPPDAMDVMDVTDAVAADPTPTSATLVVSCGTTCKRPLDAVLDATGTKVFFTAFAPDGTAGVFAVAAAGGPITALATGGGLNFPLSIAIDESGSGTPTLYIADLAADSAGGTATGAVFSVSATGGTLSRINVAGITGPSGIAVSGSNLVLTAQSTAGVSGVFQVGTAGGTASLLAAPPTPTSDLSEVALLSATTALVADETTSGRTDQGAVVNASMPMILLGHLTMSYPAGLIVSRDGAHFLVAGRAGGPGITWANIDGSSPTPVPASGSPFVSPTGIGRSRDTARYVVADELAGTPSNGAIYLVQ